MRKPEKITREDVLRWESKAAERRRRQLAKRATYLATGIWWAAAINRWHDKTGVAHALFQGGALCGARPASMGGSYRTAESTGCRECRRCRLMIDEVKKHANAQTV